MANIHVTTDAKTGKFSIKFEDFHDGDASVMFTGIVGWILDTSKVGPEETRTMLKEIVDSVDMKKRVKYKFSLLQDKDIETPIPLSANRKGSGFLNRQSQFESE